jgi:hypothetical protein
MDYSEELSDKLDFMFEEIRDVCQFIDDYYVDDIYLGDYKVVEKFQELLNKVDTFLKFVEEHDPNMKLETTNLPDMDVLFEGKAISDYINARIDYVLGDKSAQAKMNEAGRQIEAEQKAKEEEASKAIEPELNPIRTLDEFISHFIVDIHVTEDRDAFKKALIDAIHTLQTRNGTSKFGVNTDTGQRMFTLQASEKFVNITKTDDSIYYQFAFPMITPIEEEGEPYCRGEEANEGYEEAEDDMVAPCDCGCNNCIAKSAHEEEEDFEIDIFAVINTFEEDVSADLEFIMGFIADTCRHLDTFNEDNLRLIRFYLSHLPYNSHLDIEGLSDRAVELAWRQLRYNKVI